MSTFRASTELSAIVPELWSAKFYPTLLEKMPFTALMDHTYEGEIKALGDTVNISSFPQFALASAIAEDDAVTAAVVTASNTQLVINSLVALDFAITSQAQAQSLDATNALRDLAMHSIMRKMERDVVDAIIPSAAAPDHQIGYTSGTVLALVDIIAAKQLLDAANAPDDGSRCMVLQPSQWNNLYNITGFNSRDFVPAGSPLTTGGFTTPLLGFRPYMSTEAANGGANTAYLFHPSFLTVAVQKAPSPRVYEQGVDGRRGVRVNLDALYGIKQLGNTRVVELA